MNKNKPSKEDMGWKPSLSVIIGVGWLIFLLVFWAFYSGEYSTGQNIAITLLATIGAFLLLGGMWAIWGLKHMPKEGWEMFKIKGFKWRVYVSMIIPFAAVVVLIYWFWFYADDYNFWQNLAFVIVDLLAIGGILGAIWARWGIMHGEEIDKKK